MRTREELLAGFSEKTKADFMPIEQRVLEVLIDIRDLLAKDNIRSDYIEDRDNRYTKP